jgi:hypothetical protein
VSTVDEAVAAAEQVGYPVVLKSTAPMLRHQGGTSGVRVDLRTDAALRAAWESLTERLAPLDAEFLVVQRMATPGVMTSSPPTRTRSSGRSSASASPGCPPSCSGTSAIGSRPSPTSTSPS